jgi:hypothetical protein
MDEKFTFDVSKEARRRRKKMVVEKVNLQQHFFLHWRVSTLKNNKV